VGSSSKNPKKRARESNNTVQTFQAMHTPPPSGMVARAGSPPTDEFNHPIPTTVVVPVEVVQESYLTLLGAIRAL